MREAFSLKPKTNYFLLRFLGVLFVLAHELIDASGGVNQFQLAGEEGVRGVGDFQLHHGILVAVGVGDGLLGGGAALGENHVVVRHVFEHNEAIVLGMNSFFHVFSVCFAVLSSGS